MKRAKFQPIFEEKSDFCEKSSQKPVDSFVPGQAIKLSELVARFDRGQRLNVHENFKVGSNFVQMSDEDAMFQMKNEQMDDSFFPPTDVHDVVDVEREMVNHEIHKREFSERMKKKKQTPQVTTQGETQQVMPEDPAK